MTPENKKQWTEEFGELWFSTLPDYPAGNMIKRGASRSSAIYESDLKVYLAACQARTEEQAKKNEKALEALRYISYYMCSSDLRIYTALVPEIETIKAALEAK
jgi:hypothetical protein